MHWGVALHFQRIPEHRLHRSGATQLRNRASVLCGVPVPDSLRDDSPGFDAEMAGYTLPSSTQVHPGVGEASAALPGLPLSIPFS